MKMHTSLKPARARVLAVVLVTMAAATTTPADPPPLQGQLTVRSLSPQDIKDHALPADAQIASGLSTVGIGQPVHLEATVNIALPATVANVTWVLTNKPPGSAATLSTSPLGPTVPVDKPTDRLAQQLVGRSFLRPDVVGQYTIAATITTATNGTTNLTRRITAASYMGVNTCALCHSGGLIAPNTVLPWSQTLHATKFARSLDGLAEPDYSVNHIKAHTVGYDTNAAAVNGGFDDVAKLLAWTFPTNLTSGNWTNLQAKYPSLANLANIQCENCHGPGSEHAFSLGDTNRISRSFNVGTCGQCHDNKSENNFVTIKVGEWKNSRHAVSTRTPSGPGREACVRCHTSLGFAEFTATGNQIISNTVYEAIGCAACHDPHDATHPHQLRAARSYTLPEGTTVTNVGLGALCMTCHHSRNGSATENVARFKLNQPSWAGGVGFGPHDSTAGDMIEGVNGITYGKVIPSGSHSAVIPNVCVGCHMQPVASTDPAFTKAGGHTFSMTYPVVSGGITNTVAKVDVCIKCHGPITDFDLVRKDYNEDGVIQGIQTEIHHLLDELSRLLPNSTYRADGNYVADGVVKAITRTTVKTNWPTKFLNAAWNWMFVDVEGSHGIHNAPYAIGVLKASIVDLTDDADHDGLSDKWEIANFGSITSSNPYDDSDGDGLSNALELAAGTNPTRNDTDGDGIADRTEMEAGSDPLNAADKPGFVVEFHTAGELEFASEVGKTYAIQAVTELNTAWQNVSTNIPGTGGMISHLVSTRRGGEKAFYRVVRVGP